MVSHTRYHKHFLFSLMENNFLNFKGLELTNDELSQCLSAFDRLFEKSFIKHIDLSGNNLEHYKSGDITKTFHRIQNIYVSNINDIDNSHKINIIIK